MAITFKPARPGSIPAGLAPRPRPIRKDAAAKLMRQAERDPALDLEAEAVLRALLFKLAVWESGYCAPTLEAIAKAAKVSRSTVVRRLAQLDRYLSRIRRMVRVPADPAVGWRGPVRNCQITTAYYFALPASAAGPDCESQGEPPRVPKSLNLTSSRVREAGTALEAALARLGRAVEAQLV